MDALVASLDFDTEAVGRGIGALRADELDELHFGVIGFDTGGMVRVYNRYESEAAGLSLARVIGRALFTEVAPCMNNFMVAHRFAEAAARATSLDAVIDYVLTLRMRPTRVRLRLVADATNDLSYVLVDRRVATEAAQGARHAAP